MLFCRSPQHDGSVHINFKFSKSRVTCQVCRIVRVPKGNGAAVCQEAQLQSLCRRMPCCPWHKASLPPATQQGGRHWEGRKLRARHGHLLPYAADEKKAQTRPQAIGRCWGINGGLTQVLCASPLGKEYIPSPSISTQVPGASLTFIDSTGGS